MTAGVWVLFLVSFMKPGVQREVELKTGLSYEVCMAAAMTEIDNEPATKEMKATYNIPHIGFVCRAPAKDDFMKRDSI